jgi:hypothetical protein
VVRALHHRASDGGRRAHEGHERWKLDAIRRAREAAGRRSAGELRPVP